MGFWHNIYSDKTLLFMAFDSQDKSHIAVRMIFTPQVYSFIKGLKHQMKFQSQNIFPYIGT